MGERRVWLGGALAALTSAALGFALHLMTARPIARWVSEQTPNYVQGPSWDVRIPAALSSIEIGVGAVIIYALMRAALPMRTSIGRGLCLGVLLLAAHGRLFRQPLLDWLVGNPARVVLVQDGMSWLSWLLIGVVVAVIYDATRPKANFRQALERGVEHYTG